MLDSIDAINLYYNIYIHIPFYLPTLVCKLLDRSSTQVASYTYSHCWLERRVVVDISKMIVTLANHSDCATRVISYDIGPNKFIRF